MGREGVEEISEVPIAQPVLTETEISTIAVVVMSEVIIAKKSGTEISVKCCQR